MNICLLADTYPPEVGGLAQAASRHGKNLVSQGHRVHALIPSDQVPPGEIRTTAESGVTVHRLGRSQRMCDTLTDWTERACALERQMGFDVFHGYFVTYGGFVAAYAARYCGRRSVVSARGNDLDRLVFDSERAPFTFWVLQWADAITTVSAELRHKVWALAGRNDAVVIPNGVDSELFQPPAEAKDLTPLRQSLGLAPGPVIGFVGEARIKKGLPSLLRAFAQIAPAPGAQLLLVGGVREKDQPILDLFLRQHPKLPVHVVPYQPQSALSAYYHLMDLVLQPSLRDGLPNALLEAMACGRATVSTAVGGIADVIEDGVDGWLVPPRDERALVERILAALADPQARQRLGLAARQKVLAQYTLERELAANLSLYQRLLGLQSV